MQYRLAAFALVASAVVATDAEARRPNPADWEVGPVINGRSRSTGVALRPQPHPLGMAIDIPQHGSVNYVTFRHGPLAGKRRISMRYRIEAAPGVRIVPRRHPTYQSILSLYFQRRGDNWSARGPFEAFRWYSTFRTHTPIVPGEHVLTAGLNENWSALQSSNTRNNPAAFRAALAETDRVGFVLGGGDGYGHGVRATGPARLIVTDFTVD